MKVLFGRVFAHVLFAYVIGLSIITVSLEKSLSGHNLFLIAGAYIAYSGYRKSRGAVQAFGLMALSYLGTFLLLVRLVDVSFIIGLLLAILGVACIVYLVVLSLRIRRHDS